MLMRTSLLIFLVWLFPSEAAWSSVEGRENHYRQLIEQFKNSLRGPFQGVKWFCKDGTILPPKENACRPHGGGRQHGEWNDKAYAMRASGYLVGNVISALNPEDFTGPDARLDMFKQVLLERFLIRADNGWVFRKARFYRGAIQVEDEQAAANAILGAMLNDPAWLKQDRYLLLREAVRLLPLAVEPQLGAKIRQAATEISEKDEGFYELRIKIHGMPDASDAERVRAYALKSGHADLQEVYEALAVDMDTLYAAHTTTAQLKQLADESWNRNFKKEMAEAVAALEAARGALETVKVAAAMSQRFRSILLQENNYTVHNRLRFLRASLILEQEIYARGNQLVEMSEHASRKEQLVWLRHLAAAVHATGLLSDRQWQAVRRELNRLNDNPSLTSAEYYRSLKYLARTTQWAQQSMQFHFAPTVELWQGLSDLAQSYVPDRVRSTPLLPFVRILDALIADAGQLSGITHSLFGGEVATGIRGLNPGLQRGVLLQEPEKDEPLRRGGIYILQSTRQELTPVAGIITRGEGSSMSHVQLLARNMGIPNLVVDEKLYRRIQGYIGEKVVVAISPQGAVSIEPDGPVWDKVFGREEPLEALRIHVDLSKLKLSERGLQLLSSLRRSDSGRIVGPKAANLGELNHHFPEMVNPGIAIPFGVFRRYLEQPLYDGGPPVFGWMKSEYMRLALITDPEQKQQQSERFLKRLRTWIESGDPGRPFRQELQQMLEKTFGEEGSYGVFVRSDTNVEDLPGFSGAGLNLTVPHVVGYEAIMKAVLRVWASPFSDRSYAWRQSHMDMPEHVYPAVLLMKSFASEKSGVLVTSDIDNGDRGVLSVAVNEGIGGAVEGQAAEELRVQRSNGGVTLISQASASLRKALNPQGGIDSLPASGRQFLLTRGEIDQLQSLATRVERGFPMTGVADIEFGFRKGKLSLFQIRPFVESSRARSSRTLIEMDRRAAGRGSRIVRMDRPPQPSELL